MTWWRAFQARVRAWLNARPLDIRPIKHAHFCAPCDRYWSCDAPRCVLHQASRCPRHLARTGRRRRTVPP